MEPFVSQVRVRTAFTLWVRAHGISTLAGGGRCWGGVRSYLTPASKHLCFALCIAHQYCVKSISECGMNGWMALGGSPAYTWWFRVCFFSKCYILKIKLVKIIEWLAQSFWEPHLEPVTDHLYELCVTLDTRLQLITLLTWDPFPWM